MVWQYTPYLIPLFIAAAVSLALARYAWKRRPAAGATPLAIFMMAAAEWCIAYALELGGIGLETKVFWAKMQYFGIVTVAWMMLILMLEYAGYDKWLTSTRTIFLGIIPFITLYLVWTNDTHHLIWTSYQLVPYGNFEILDLGHGNGFWMIIAYSYTCLLIGMGVLVGMYRRSSPVYRAQVGIMLAGTFAPWIGNALYVTELNPFPHLDLTPFAFTLTGLAATWGLFRFQFMDVVPIARDAVIEGMHDGLLVLDRQNRIVDINPIGLKILELTDC
jgi:PAS domain-containing protein